VEGEGTIALAGGEQRDSGRRRPCRMRERRGKVSQAIVVHTCGAIVTLLYMLKSHKVLLAGRQGFTGIRHAYL
jgi:hypothetical protein